MILGCILFFATVMCFSVGVSMLSGKRLCITFLPGIVLATLFTYAVVLCGAFCYAPYILPVVALAFAFTIFFIKRKKFEGNISREIFPLADVILLVAFAALFIAFSYGREFSLNDEFSHWGLAIKNMFINNDFYTVAESNDMFKSYPPFATLACALCSSFTFSYSESATFFAMDMMLIACLLPIYAGVSERCKKNAKNFAFVFAPLCLFLGIFAVLAFKLSAFSIIAVDTLLGTLAFYIVAESLVSRDLSFLPFGACALVLTKEIGIALAITMCIISMAAWLFRNKITAKSLVCLIKPFVCTAASIALAKISWALVLSADNVTTRGSTAAKFAKMLSHGLTPNQKTIVSNYFKAFLEPKISFGVPLLVIFAALTIISLAIIFLKINANNARSRTSGKDDVASHTERASFARTLLSDSVVINLGMFISFIIFSFATLVSYLVNFSEYEGLQLASFERYFGTFLTIWALTEIWLLAEFVCSKANLLRQSRAALPVVGTIFVAFALGLAVLFFGVYPYPAATSGSTKASYSDEVSFIETGIVKSHPGKVLVVSQSFENRDRLALDYILAPFSFSAETDIEKALASGDYSYIYVSANASSDQLKTLRTILNYDFFTPISESGDSLFFQLFLNPPN